MNSNCAKGIEYIIMLNITITNSPNQIEMNSNETENLTIDGIVRCEMYGVRYVIVNLEVTDTLGNSVIDPTSITFSGSGIQEESFEITVQIPPLSEGEFNESVRVNGSATVYPGPYLTTYIDSESVDISIRVINETNIDSPDTTSEKNGGFDNGSGIIFIVGVLVIIIFVIVLIWIIKRRKQKLLEIY